MRVLAVYYTHKPGGLCKRLYRLLSGLGTAGDEAIYLSLDEPPSGATGNSAWKRIPFPLSARSGLLFWALFTLWCPIYCAWVARRIRPDRLVAFGAYYSSMLVIARTVARAPLVLFCRSLVFRTDELTGRPAWLSFFTRLVDRIGFRAADGVVFMTNAMKADIERFTRRRFDGSIIIPNDLPPIRGGSRASRKDDGTLVCLAAGILNEGKNISLLLDAMAILEGEGADVELVVAGEGSIVPKLEERAKELGLSRVRFPGWQESLEPLFAECDILLHPALAEGMPNTVLEAMAFGLPVMGARTAELWELLGDDRLLFDPEDPSELAGKLDELARSPKALEESRRLSAAASERYRFDWEERAREAIRGISK